MKISDIITEAGVYKTDNLANLGDLIKQKQKADAKAQSWSDRGISNDKKPGLPHKKDPGNTSDWAKRQRPLYKGSSYSSRPLSVEPDSGSSPLNTGVRELFNQGMSPSEIEDYLVFRKKIKRNLARQIIDKELYEPASRPKRANPYGSNAFTMPHRSQQKQQDDEEDKY